MSFLFFCSLSFFLNTLVLENTEKTDFCSLIQKQVLENMVKKTLNF